MSRKKQKSKISAIVSAYYAEDYIHGRIENLLSQQPCPEVVVVCQKGSKEEEIATSFERPEIFIVETLDIPTIYDAWNTGIEFSNGDYLTNANCDDRLYPGALSRLRKALDKNKEYAVAYFDIDIVTSIDGTPAGQFRWNEGGIEELLNGCFLGPMPMWRRELHEKYGLFDGKMHSAGDYEFWLRIARAGEQFYHIKEVRGAYLRRDNQAEHREPTRSLWEQARARGRYREGIGIWVEPEMAVKE